MTDGTFATDPSTRRLGDELALFSARLYERGWMPGTSGNLSARLRGAPDRVLITASGRDKGELTAQDMVVVDAGTGDLVEPTALRASAETSIHAAVYRTTDAQAVIHVHSPYATAIACRAGRETQTTLVRLEHFELLKGLGLADATGTDLPVFPNWVEVPRIAADVADYYEQVPAAPPGLLIARHGITTWGKDLAQARNRLECLESICQLLVIGAGEIRFPTTPTDKVRAVLAGGSEHPGSARESADPCSAQTPSKRREESADDIASGHARRCA